MSDPQISAEKSKPLYFRPRTLVSGAVAYDVIRWSYERQTLTLEGGSVKVVGRTKPLIMGSLTPADGRTISTKLRDRLSPEEAAEAQTFWRAHNDRLEADSSKRAMQSAPVMLDYYAQAMVAAITADVLTAEQLSGSLATVTALAKVLKKASAKASKATAPADNGHAEIPTIQAA